MSVLGLTREWALIHAVFQHGHVGFRRIKRWGIQPHHLGEIGDDERKVWDLFEARALAPTLPTITDVFHATGIAIPSVTDPCDPDFYAVLVRDWALYQHLERGLSPIISSLEVDPIAKRDEIVSLVHETAWIHAGTIDRTNNPESIREVRKAYERAKALRKTGKLQGYSSPWPSWDARSLGLQDGKLMILLGKREAGKTMLSLIWANHIWTNDLKEGEKIIYVSMEMDPLTVKQRLYAIRNKLDYGKFREGRLTKIEEDRFFAYCEEHEKRPDPTKPEIIFLYSNTVKSVADVAAVALEHKAKVIFIDGLYILGRGQRKSNYERVLSNAEDTKILLANGLNVPVIVTSQFRGQTQRNDLKADADDAGHAKAMSDYADMILGIFSDEAMRVGGERIIKCLKGREFRPIHWRMRFHLDVMDFKEIEVVDDGEDFATTTPTTTTKPTGTGGRRSMRFSPFGSGKEIKGT